MKNKLKLALPVFLACSILSAGCYDKTPNKYEDYIKNNKNYEKYTQNNFTIKLSPLSFEGDLLCRVQLWSKENKQEYPTNPVDGDTDFTYSYHPAHTAFGDDIPAYWLKATNKWVEVEDNLFDSGSKAGPSLYRIPYDEVPGRPEGIPLDKPLGFDVDFDKGEEYAKGDFLDKKHAKEWAERMIEILSK